MRFSHLELWPVEAAVEQQFQLASAGEGTIGFKAAPTTSTSYEQFGESAQLKAYASGVFGSPTAWGSRIDVRTWLELDGLSGWTVEEILTRFTHPMESLLTLLANEEGDCCTDR
ncbi:hypothetical protein [Pimelobacter simplex]|uniref:hypothetical protein n=1 Tax=Nocardioides simplex TaxID=2045 RepID=UPI001933C3C4|nr:hypothetical protein [Pimelobacter simplex]